MKVLHTISSMNISTGGPASCTYILLKGLLNKDIDVTLLTYAPPQGERLISNESFIQTVEEPRSSRYGYSNLFRNKLDSFSDIDIVHANGLWQYTTHASAKFARRTNKPFVLTTHGMLYPEGLKKSKWIKKVSLWLYQRDDIDQATVLHVTCKQEFQIIRDLGITVPIAVIPHPIEIQETINFSNNYGFQKKIGFIGRFAPIKNIENLIHAWNIAAKNRDQWELVLIGDGEAAYSQSLKQLAVKLGIKNIRLTGFLSGLEKEEALASVSFLVLPSKSENFGMVVPEALIREIPVIASKGTPWEELNNRNAGWWIEPGVEPLVQALQKAMQLSDNERQQIGQNGRRLVEENYSIDSVTKQMIELYNWVLGNVEKPSFVINV
ncbi:MAG: glycosyltransferase [Bacteroidia bacterium]|nr:glycosyltransferase [Bacteroidia bacterium]